MKDKGHKSYESCDVAIELPCSFVLRREEQEEGAQSWWELWGRGDSKVEKEI